MRRTTLAAGILTLVTARAGIADEAARARLEAEVASARASLQEAQIQLERLHRLFPPEHDQAALLATIEATAKRADLPAPEVEHLPASPGPPGVLLHGARLSGRAPYARVYFFLSILGLGPRPMDLQELDLRAAEGGSVDYRATLVLPTITAVVPPPTPARPSPAAGNPQQAHDAAVEAYFRRQIADLEARRDATRAAVQALSSLAEHRTGRLSLAAGLLTNELDEAPVAVGRMRVAAQLVVEGVAMGDATRATLAAAAEKAGLTVGDLRLTPSGLCQAFVLTASPPSREAPFDGVFGNGLFDDRAAEHCTPPAILPAVIAKGSGPLTLRLAKAEVPDVFRALHENTQQSFVVDADVRGVATVDLSGVTLDEALAAFGKAGLRVGPGPLRRVSRAAAAVVPSTQQFTGDPMTMNIRRGNVRHLLRLFEEDSGLTILVPPGVRGEISVFVHEVAWDRVLDAIVTAAGLAWKVDGTRVYVGPPGQVSGKERTGFVSVSDVAKLDLHREWWQATPRP